MSKIPTVVFGGSFDPIHNGHIALATEVCRQGLAVEVWLLVSPLNPHKEGNRLTPEDVRLQMAMLALAGNPSFKACDFEFSMPRPSYTVNTLAALSQAYPDREFILLIGADNWEKFHKWYRWEEILSQYRIIVYPRGNEQEPLLPAGVTWLPAPLYNVSSTMVREAVARGEDISSLVPAEVSEFIKDCNLYR